MHSRDHIAIALPGSDHKVTPTFFTDRDNGVDGFTDRVFCIGGGTLNQLLHHPCFATRSASAAGAAGITLACEEHAAG